MLRYWLTNNLLSIVSLVVLLNSQVVFAQSSTTVIDILSENVEFSYFLRLLQKNQLIPYLNQLHNFTLAAPVNPAFIKAFCPDKASVSDCDLPLQNFNVHDLNAYIVDAPISSTDFEGYNVFKGVLNEEIDQKYPNPVLTYINSEQTSFLINNIDVDERDLFANAQGSYVQGVEKLFDTRKIEDILNGNSQYTFLNSLLETYQGSLDEVTLLIPLDESVKFEPYEISYLLSSYGEDDKNLILKSLIVDGYHGGRINDTFSDRNGFPVAFTSDNEGKHITLNGTIESVSATGVSANALYHTFSHDSLIPNIEFDAMKVLIGLGASAFVDELILQKLSHLITDNSLEQTIFYAKEPSQFSTTSKSSNLYHFVEEKIEDLSQAKTLYNTRLCNSKKFGTSCQRIKIEAVGENSYMLNNNVLIESGPFKVGNTVIYLTDDNVRTPNELLASVNPIFHCTKSLNLLSRLKLTSFSNNGLGYTVFLPCFDSFRDFDLTLNYLNGNKPILEKVMRNTILEGLVYSDIERNVELSNLNQEKVLVHDLKTTETGDLRIKLNNESILLKQSDDILFSQGVVHPVRKLLIPDDVIISLEDIIENSIISGNLFLDYLQSFEPFENVLQSEKDYSILLPATFKFDPLEITNSTIEKILMLHVIPKASLADLYKCDQDVDIQTLNPKVNLTCTKISDSSSFLSIKNGAENGVNVVTRGCTNNDDRSCVYLIDKPINLKWIDGDSHLHISLPGIALGIGIILGCLLMVLVLSCLMLVILPKRNKTLTETNRGEQNNENSSLIDSTEGDTNNYQSAYNNSFEAGYSDNTHVDPINFPNKKGQTRS